MFSLWIVLHAYFGESQCSRSSRHLVLRFNSNLRPKFFTRWTVDTQSSIVYRVTILKKVGDENSVFYTPEGRPSVGPYWIKHDLTEFFSPAQIDEIAQDIVQHRLEEFADTQVEIAQERALDRYLQFPSYFEEGPMHFTGVPVT